MYEYNSIGIIDRIETFSGTTFWLRIKHFDLEACTEKFNDKNNTVYLADYSKAVEQVLALRDRAKTQGAYQRPRAVGK